MRNFKNILLLLLIQFFAQVAFCGVGGIGGGSNAMEKFVIIKLCDGGESGSECREIRLNAKYYDQDGNLKQPSVAHPQPCVVYQGEGIEAPCNPEAVYGVPKFLKKLNEIFGDRGQPAPTIDPYIN